LQQNREQELKDPVIQFITHKPYGNYSGLELLFKPKAYVRKSLVKIMERVHKKNPALYTREAMDRDLAYIKEWAAWFEESAPEFYRKQYIRWQKLQVYKYYYVNYVLKPVQKVVISSEFEWSQDAFEVELYTFINDKLESAKEATPPAEFSVEGKWITDAINRIQMSVNEKKGWSERECELLGSSTGIEILGRRYADFFMPAGSKHVLNLLCLSTLMVIEQGKVKKKRTRSGRNITN
jgi:hypothetical protein